MTDADAAGIGRPLDAWVRRAPLRLETGDPEVSIGEWRASFHPLDGTMPSVEAGGTGDGGTPSSGVSLTGPDTPGTYRLVAHATLSDGADVEAAWTVLVPERDLPADGLIDVPAPELLLARQPAARWRAGRAAAATSTCASTSVAFRRCGWWPSSTSAEGEELTLRLSDDSGIAAWKVTLYPIVSGVEPAVHEVGAEPEVAVDSFGFQAPVAGEWLMQAEVTYDRLRGWTHAFYRLTSR